MGLIEDILIGGDRMNLRHERMFNSKGLIKQGYERYQCLGRAGDAGDDLIARLDLIVVYTKNHVAVNVVKGRRPYDHPLGAGA